MGFADRANAGLGETIHDRGGELVTAYVEGLATVLEATDALVGPTDRGWSPGHDLDLTPYPAWLGQALGVTVPIGLATLDDQRDYVRARPYAKRGTRWALVNAIFPLLTGTQAVGIVERDGSPWRLTLRILDSETTHTADEIAAACEPQKPVGIVLNVELVPDVFAIPTRWWFPGDPPTGHGSTYFHAGQLWPTYDDWEADMPTYTDAIDN